MSSDLARIAELETALLALLEAAMPPEPWQYERVVEYEERCDEYRTARKAAWVALGRCPMCFGADGKHKMGCGR